MDLYKVLSISRTASLAEIKNAYRSWALQLHPDVTGNDAAKAAKFQVITNAYNTLSDDSARRAYDRTIGNQRVSHGGSKSSGTSGSRYASPNPRVVRTSRPVSSEHFNMAVWNAWHYGDNAVAQSSVNRNSWMNMKANSHQSYYNRRARNMKDNPDMTAAPPAENSDRNGTASSSSADTHRGRPPSNNECRVS